MERTIEAQIPLTPSEVLCEYERLTALRRETLEFHMPYHLETQMLLYVKSGDPEGLLAFHKALVQGGGTGCGSMSSNALAQSRCQFMAGITLFTRFAVEGGLDQEEAYNLSDAYIQAMCKLNEEGPIQALSLRSGLDFAARVRGVRPVCAPCIKACLAYISKRLHDKITLSALAAECALSPSYLSALFHTQMGVTIQAYIRGEKLEAARVLLLTGHSTVSEVASQFAFSSHSSFDAQFKARFGAAPSHYRRTHHSAAWGALG